MKELSIAKERGDRAGEGVASFNLGGAYYVLGDFQQSIEYCTQSLSIAKERGDRAREGVASFNLGSAYYKLCDFQQAIEYYTQSVSIAKERGDRAGEGDASFNLGNACYNLGDFQQAIEYYTQSLSIAKEAGNRVREGDASCNLGIAYFNLGDFQQAIEYCKQSLSIAKERGDRAGEGVASFHLGNPYYKLGDFQQAIEYYSQSVSIAKEVGNRAVEGNASLNLGSAFYNLGDFQQAIQLLSVAKDLTDRENEGLASRNLGNAYNSLGNFKQAIECHKEDLRIAKQIGNRASEGRAYDNLGFEFSTLGNFKQAIQCHKQALSVAKEVGNRHDEGSAYCNLGTGYAGLGNFQQATENYKHGLSIFKEVGDSFGEAKTYCGLANVNQGLGDFEQAREYQKQYLRIAKEVGDREAEGKACGPLGNAYFCLGNFKQAIEYHKQYLCIAKETGRRVGVASPCFLLGLDYEATASISEALDYYRSSIRLLDYTRTLLKSDDALKISFQEMYRGVYTALWRVLSKAGETDEALCAAEQGRAQALIDVLKRQYGVDSPPSGTAGPSETISYILNELSTQTVFVALAGSSHKDMISFWVLRNGREVLFKHKMIEHGYASMLMEATLKEIGAGVGVRCENRSMDELSDEPQTTREAVEGKDQSRTSSVNSLRPLYDVIIGPIADLLQGDQLIVVPDGPFCLAPYSALSESIRIRVVPSLTTLQLIAGAPDDFHCKSGALLVGDPCLDEVPMSLSQLPYAKKEVEMIGKLLKTTPLTGKDATKDEVVKRLKSVALVHIAAHGCAQSGEIVLALDPGRKSQPLRRQDFILTMSDVQAACLRARLVVLSCCHSGRGEVKSEGVVGIARSFLFAGARSVLVSLWKIDDEATMVFMESFYQHLADGKSASVALHQAMKSLRKSEEFSAVKYWAPFVLIGDDVRLKLGEQK